MDSWIKRRVYGYERMRFDQELNRRTLPFAWGVEHLEAGVNGEGPRAFLRKYAEQTIAGSDEWYAVEPAEAYRVADDVLTFTSAISSPWAENNRVYAQLFPAKRKGSAVVVLAQWNARWEEQQSVCRWLQRLGITAVKVSLPYHDKRAIPGHPRADHLVGPYVGLTMQAMRQAVLDVRRTLRWLESQEYGPLGVLGTSIGSAIGFITMCHEPAIRAGAFVHASTYFGEVVATGLTTTNVWEPLANAGITPEEIRRFWSPISPFPYIFKLRDAKKKILLITGKHDPTFSPELTERLLAELRHEQVEFEHLALSCGHYSMGVWPFSHIAGYRFGKFLQKALAMEPRNKQPSFT
jgi:dienelactone hydrolase